VQSVRLRGPSTLALAGSRGVNDDIVIYYKITTWSAIDLDRRYAERY
jgi:hypothetical protein